ncbi:hypothetical protein GCM10009830_16950 [Glycomyces endophyticus]|uniref:Uncharacterized protein n=1 Tax=Glycomyces endophyticus TaxID=480996 RepID=A0ABP4SGE8_9ACTN
MACELFRSVARRSGFGGLRIDAKPGQRAGESVENLLGGGDAAGEFASLFGITVDCTGSLVDTGHEETPLIRGLPVVATIAIRIATLIDRTPHS